MPNHTSPSGRRPQRSPVKTRAVTNGKAPMAYASTRRNGARYATQYGAEGPFEGQVHMAPDTGALAPVPEDKPLRNGPTMTEGMVVWAVTVALVIFLTCGTQAEFRLKTPVIPAPPTSVPFTVLGFLRKAFTSSDY